MRMPVSFQDGVQQGVDFDAHYRLTRTAVAWRLLGWAMREEPIMCNVADEDGKEVEVESGEFEAVPDYENVVAVMVGDDRREVFAVSDLDGAKIGEGEFCRDCGQIGCGCNVYA